MVKSSTPDLIDSLAVFIFQWRKETENSFVASFQHVERRGQKTGQKTQVSL